MADYTVIEFYEDFGVRAELHAIIGNAKHEARVHVFDVDAGEAVGNTFYPTMAMAKAAFVEYKKNA